MTELIVETPAEQVPAEPNLAEVMAVLKTLQVPQADPTPAEPELKPVTQPAPAAPPTPPAGGRITRKAYDELMQYAAEQAQRAEKLSLGQEFGLTEQELEGTFESPADMRRHAEVLSLRKSLADLELRLASQAVSEGAPIPAVQVPLAPNADTGGQSSIADSVVEELRGKYEAARALGRTPAGRRAMLEAIYGDPTRRSLHINRGK